MPLLNDTTQVSAAKSANEIQKKLVDHGASSIRQDYQDGKVTSISFQTQTPYGTIAFRLPANTEAVYKVLCKQLSSWASAETEKGWSSRSEQLVNAHRQQAERVAWRILKDWTEAQMAILDSEIVHNPEIFLPYMLVDGKTLYQGMLGTQFQLKPG